MNGGPSVCLSASVRLAGWLAGCPAGWLAGWLARLSSSTPADASRSPIPPAGCSGEGVGRRGRGKAFRQGQPTFREGVVACRGWGCAGREAGARRRRDEHEPRAPRRPRASHTTRRDPHPAQKKDDQNASVCVWGEGGARSVSLSVASRRGPSRALPIGARLVAAEAGGLHLTSTEAQPSALLSLLPSCCRCCYVRGRRGRKGGEAFTRAWLAGLSRGARPGAKRGLIGREATPVVSAEARVWKGQVWDGGMEGGGGGGDRPSEPYMPGGSDTRRRQLPSGTVLQPATTRRSPRRLHSRHP
eukprot:358416-Chlamydomonas_euryale.AAC.5